MFSALPITTRISVLLTLPVALISIWLFGAWEAWFFWPFCALIFLGTALFSIRALGRFEEQHHNIPGTSSALLLAITITYGIFLCYGFIRTLQADVRMDAERNFALFLTPLLLALPIVHAFPRKFLAILFWSIMGNLTLVACYGIVNHFVYQNAYVLWLPGEPSYQLDGIHRATGPVFCPDHFSGLMEILFCGALSLILSRHRPPWVAILGSALALLALTGVLLSKSRGGGLTIVVICIAALLWGLRQWPGHLRWIIRASALVVVLGSITLFFQTQSQYVVRFKSYFPNPADKTSRQEYLAHLVENQRYTCRGIMYAAAYRAWQTAPLLGIAPGMHQNLWPHFDSSADGDLRLERWPSISNPDFHSYEVHNDWLQLLEEYGAIGLGLFLIPFSILALLLFRLLRHVPQNAVTTIDPDVPMHYVLTALLAMIALSFHSLGDFNLQIPAITWILTCVIAIPLSCVRRLRSAAENR